MANRTAVVFYGDVGVGTLREDANGELQFTYYASWIEDSDSFPISASLPFDDEEQFAHPFFSGLLPEERVRERICRALGIDNRDDTGLLFAIGEDVAGALSVVHDAVQRDDTLPSPLSAADVETLARRKGVPQADKEERRFSLAGAQEKQPVIYDAESGSYAWPNRQHPSTHILKFETHPNVCLAEALALRTAAELGLDTIEFEHLQTKGDDPEPYLRIRRYDRIVHPEGRAQRLHQEDLLQAIGQPTALKYEEVGGPALSEVAALLRETVAVPGNDILKLRDWQIFNVLIGNWDGHAKNLALLFEPGAAAPRLAPFYDLVAIEFLNFVNSSQWARKLAFRVGGQDQADRVGRQQWEQMAADLEIPARPTVERVIELATRLEDAVERASKAIPGTLHNRLEAYAKKRSRAVLGPLNVTVQS